MKSHTSLAALGLLALTACSPAADSGKAATAGSSQAAAQTACEFVQDGWGPKGTVSLHVEKVLTGLQIPWSLSFLPGGDWLITERPGALRLVRNGKLVPQPILTLPVGENGEGGVLGLALHPDFSANRLFYIYYTAVKNSQSVNRVQRFVLSADHSSATPDRIILDDIPAGSFHDGGRIKFGPDGMLYIGTGDSRNPDLAQDNSSLNGKILRISPEGAIPANNPIPRSPLFASGIRNLEAFDWVNPNLLIVADNGPTGELGLTGLDKVSFVSAGSNLGWPRISGCQTQTGLVNPILSWKTSAPPGGGVLYHGSAIPEFQGDFLVGMLGIGSGTAMQLHRVHFDADHQSLISHEVYLQGEFGRLRDVVQGPDGALYVTTSNCDTRGICPPDGDSVLRITHG